MKLLYIFLLLLLSGCTLNRADKDLLELSKETNDKVFVVAHRGDWETFPENSLESIKSCIDIGVDIVEIDVRMTKDSILVLMHDETINRTTNGTGYIKNLTYNFIKTLYLKSKNGKITTSKVPKLKEVLSMSKDKILLNIDNKDYSLFPLIIEVLKKTNTSDQIIIKSYQNFREVKQIFGNDFVNMINFMPQVRLKDKNVHQVITEYIDSLSPIAFETKFIEEKEYLLRQIKKNKIRIWENSLGHENKNPEKVWEKLIERGVTIIQTDKPKHLLKYLTKKKLR